MTTPIETTPERRARLRFWAGLVLVVGGLVYATFLIWGLVTEGDKELGPWGLVAFLIVIGFIVSGKLRPRGWGERRQERAEDAARAKRYSATWRCECGKLNTDLTSHCTQCGRRRP